MLHISIRAHPACDFATPTIWASPCKLLDSSFVQISKFICFVLFRSKTHFALKNILFILIRVIHVSRTRMRLTRTLYSTIFYILENNFDLNNTDDSSKVTSVCSYNSFSYGFAPICVFLHPRLTLSDRCLFCYSECIIILTDRLRRMLLSVSGSSPPR